MPTLSLALSFTHFSLSRVLRFWVSRFSLSVSLSPMSTPAAPPSGAAPLTGNRNVAAAYARYLPPRWGLSVNTFTDGQGSAEKAMGRLDRKGLDSGLMRDWTYKSPLAPGTCKYEKPTQRRQRIERKGAWEAKQKHLLAILRTVLFKKNRG